MRVVPKTRFHIVQSVGVGAYCYDPAGRHRCISNATVEEDDLVLSSARLQCLISVFGSAFLSLHYLQRLASFLLPNLAGFQCRTPHFWHRYPSRAGSTGVSAFVKYGV